MKNASILLLLILLSFLQRGTAQDIMHSFGLYPSFAEGKLSHRGVRQEASIFLATVTYFPRYNFKKFENRSISVGIPVGVGPAIVGVHLNYYTTLGISVPIVLDYNIAYKSTRENNKSLGCYIGAGFGFDKIIVSDSDFKDFSELNLGPLLRAGVRVPPPDWFLNLNWAIQ